MANATINYYPPLGSASPFTVENTGSTTSDHSYLEVKVSGTGGGDPHLRFTIPSGTSWYVGPDNSDSDTLKIGTGTAVGTSAIFSVTAAGRAVLGGDAATSAVQEFRCATGSNGAFEFYEGGSHRWSVAAIGSDDTFLVTGSSGSPNVIRATQAGSVQLGGASTGGALATTATDGFPYIPVCAGTPTGVPTAVTGGVAIVWDTTNKILYVYDGSWLGGTNPGAFT